MVVVPVLLAKDNGYIIIRVCGSIDIILNLSWDKSHTARRLVAY
jgi:hypothetical protein